VFGDGGFDCRGDACVVVFEAKGGAALQRQAAVLRWRGGCHVVEKGRISGQPSVIPYLTLFVETLLYGATWQQPCCNGEVWGSGTTVGPEEQGEMLARKGQWPSHSPRAHGYR